MNIDETAPAVARSQLEIRAAREIVWAVLADIEEWPSWNPDVKSMAVQGPIARGSVFRWKAGPGTITSTIQRVEPPRQIAWTGRTLGTKAIHFSQLEPRSGKTLVRTEEPFEGLLARILRGSMQKTLDSSLADGLRFLKAEVERRAPA
jgi:uncharacterized protein YndB with AHSA1/START domain